MLREQVTYVITFLGHVVSKAVLLATDPEKTAKLLQQCCKENPPLHHRGPLNNIKQLGPAHPTMKYT